LPKDTPKGHTQTYGIDYHETFVPVIKMNTVQILLSVMVNNGWNLQQMDIKNVFLQRTLEEEVYIILPPVHKKKGISNLICRLE
jgi:Reverse transcriptase (RNA-dependent DNA polymerase)